MSWIEIIADRKIRDAQEEGAFENLPGKGKPLKLDYDPRVPPELRAAYRLMREANVLPDWIQLDKEVRERHALWLQRIETFSTTWSEELARRPGSRSERFDRGLDARRDAFLIQVAEGLREVNRSIDRLNLIVPTPSRQRARLQLARELELLADRFPRLTPADPEESVPWASLVHEERSPTRLDNRMPIKTRRGAIG